MFKLKQDSSSHIEGFKARLVLRGHAQKKDIDYHQLFQDSQHDIERDVSVSRMSDQAIHRRSVNDHAFQAKSHEIPNNNVDQIAQDDSASMRKVPASLRQVHELLARVNKGTATVKKFLTMANIDFHNDLNQCASCTKAKQPRASYHSRPIEAKTRELGTAYADLCSPSTVSLGGAKHFLMIADEFSRSQDLLS